MGTVPSSQPSLALITMKILLSVCLSVALTAAFPTDNAEEVAKPEKVDDDSFIEEQGKFGYGYSHHRYGSHHHVSFYQQSPDHHSYKPKCETVYETSYTTVTEQKCSTSYETKCETSYEEECSTTYETTYEEKCETSYEEECKTEYETSYEEECDTSFKELCFGHGNNRKCEKITGSVRSCTEVPVLKPVSHCNKVP